ncbi:hypothetical protein CIHG_08969 [Coccidioides immitis H538.4]|uniref:DUF1446 domain-containing protein n=1 Tax=Coccidioides immitis H538.4 TaxID=396776 RepID=A0A0J8UTH5_COCIT|nr:hypothetical protein CIHG_08969 [Coccidioides immitis H538.4]
MAQSSNLRWACKGQRPVRIANCSGAREMNLAEHAEAVIAGKHPGYDPYALDGIEKSIDAIWEKQIKLILNAGALNPRGLAKEVSDLIRSRGYDLKVAYVAGDNLLEEVRKSLEITGQLPAHLDSNNDQVQLQAHATDLLDTHKKPVVSANAYLGARAIVKGLEQGADIIICGRVADASPVIGAAWFWHGWSDTDYDALAGGLVAGHLIECSAYVTGSNFSGFTEFDTDMFLDLPFGIAEVAEDGTTVVTKHENTKGLVNADVVKCQFLYELQGDVYLNSDVKAYTRDIVIENIGKDRVKVSGLKGAPPPPTTKLAIFYRGGYEGQLLVNATGYGTDKKWELFEKQGSCGTRAVNPSSQLQSTTYCRVVSQAEEADSIMAVPKAMQEFTMQHFSGFHLSLDMRTAIPRPYLAFYPALYPQQALNETVTFLNPSGADDFSIAAGHPSRYEPLEARCNYETDGPCDLCSFGPMKTVRLGDIALGRSGDKGANINIGLFVRSVASWDWFRTFMTRERIRELMGQDDRGYFIERVEFPNLLAVHFVIYGIRGREVSSSTKLDCLAKRICRLSSGINGLSSPHSFLKLLRISRPYH